MDHFASAAIRTGNVQGTFQHGDEQWSEGCAAMRVAYRARAQVYRVEEDDAIAILIPGDRAVFEATLQLADEERSQRFPIRGPYVSLIPPSRLLRLGSERPAEVIVLALSTSFYRKMARSALGAEPPAIRLHRAVDDPLVKEIGNALRTEFTASRLPGSVYLESLARVIAVHLAAKFGLRRALPSVGLSQPKFNRVVAFIKEHLAETIKIVDLAATVHMSPCHFARMFKQTAGQSPHVYIIRHRVERAKDLLRGTELPLVDVAASAGFQTQAHFTGVFHRYAGSTPRVYRLRDPIRRRALEEYAKKRVANDDTWQKGFPL
jgi:AraC family transcriptional regulator